MLLFYFLNSTKTSTNYIIINLLKTNYKLKHKIISKLKIVYVCQNTQLSTIRIQYNKIQIKNTLKDYAMKSDFGIKC